MEAPLLAVVKLAKIMNLKIDAHTYPENENSLKSVASSASLHIYNVQTKVYSLSQW